MIRPGRLFAILLALSLSLELSVSFCPVSAQTSALTEPNGWTAHDGAVTSIAFSPNGQWMATAGMDRIIKLWSTDSFKQVGIFRGHTGPVWALSWSPDSQSLMSGSEDGTLKFWDPTTRKVTNSLSVGAPVLSVAVSSDRLRLAAGTSERKVKVWNYRNPSRAETVPGTTDLMNDVRFIPGSTTLVVPMSRSGLSFWDAALHEPVGAIDIGSSPIAVSGDGRWMVSGSGRDEAIRIWNVATRTPTASLNAHTGMVSAVAFSPDGERIASGSWDTTVRLWDVESGQLVATALEDYPVWSLAFSADGQWLVAGMDHGILKRRRVNLNSQIATSDESDIESLPVGPFGIESREAPTSMVKRPDALGVVLGIEDYRYAPDVTFARQDAASMRTYFANRLGLAEQNIYFRTDGDATQGEFHKVFDPVQGWLAKRVTPGKTEIFVYYVGHGTPDMKTGDSYLMPADSDPNYPATSYRLDELYRSLGQLPARQITVMLDACFSGRVGRGDRVEMLLEGARGIGISPRRIDIDDRIVVLTASAGNQVSSSYPEKSHGLFTYFLMRGLRGESDANNDRAVTVQELHEYVRENVMTQAGRLDREQTPELHGADPRRVLVRY